MIARRILRTMFDRIRPAPVGGQAAAEAPRAATVLVCRTHDEVNAELARSWCDDNGMDFRQAGQRDPLLPDDARALVLDVNHLGLNAGERGQFVERLFQLLLPYPVAVASYDLLPGVKSLLRSRGWLIFRHVKRQIFYDLAAALGEEHRPSHCRVPAGARISKILSGKMLQYR